MKLPILFYSLTLSMLITGKKELPSPEEVAERLFKRKEFIPDPMNTSALFAFFAQHFTHMFFKTDYYKGPGYTWGRHGVDVSNTYGHDLERENMLRAHKDGKLKSQVSLMCALLHKLPMRVLACDTRLSLVLFQFQIQINILEHIRRSQTSV